MSRPGFLERLLDGAGVEWKALNSLCDLITTGRLNANAMEDDGIYPFFTCNEKPYKINNYAFDLEAILISGNGSKVGHINYYRGKFNAYQRTYVVGNFKDNVQVMYLFHYLNHALKSYITRNSRKGSVPYITMPMLQSFLIPIPCPENPEKSLRIQGEIVRILDKFTGLTKELTKELTGRKKQYEYYRNKLLTFHDVEYKALSEVCEYVRGVTYNKSNETTSDNGFKILRANNIDISNNGLNFKDVKVISKDVKIKDAQKLRKDDILMSMASGSKTHVGKVAYVNNNLDYYFGGFMGVIRCHNIINSRFVFHLLSSEVFSQYLRESIASSTINNISSLIIKKYKIPIPPLAEQARIVSILDKFDTLVNSISEGLPREIELRQKQYEYYRNLLLDFPRPGAVA